MDEREVLRTVPIFSELSDEDITSLARLALRKRYPKDTVVFFENEEGDFFFTILEGRIKVTILGDDGREVILSVLGPGDFFGEMALLDNEPRSATAIAVEESELLSLHRNDFQTVLNDNKSITSALIRVLSARLRRANHQISTLALLDVYGRVARVIVDMAREEGKRLRDGRIAFRRATHQEIANRIGTTRETVTRMLKDLERQGLIHVEGKEMVVQPDEGLAAESREPAAPSAAPADGAAVDETHRPTPRDLAVSRTATTDVNFGGRPGARTVVACV